MQSLKELCANLCTDRMKVERVAQIKEDISNLPAAGQFECYLGYLQNEDHDQSGCLCITDDNTPHFSILDLFPDNFPSYKDPAGWTILHHTATSDKAGLIDKILSKNLELDLAKNSNLQTPLMLAVWGHEFTTISLLNNTSQSLEDVLTQALRENHHKKCKFNIVSSILKKMKEKSSTVSIEHLKMSLSFPVTIIEIVSAEMNEKVSIQDYLHIISKCLRTDSVNEKQFSALETIIDGNKEHHNMVFDTLLDDFFKTNDNILQIIANNVTESKDIQDKRLFEHFLCDPYLSNPCVQDLKKNTLGHYTAQSNNIFLLEYIYRNKTNFVSPEKNFILNIEDGDRKKPLWHMMNLLELLILIPASEIDLSTLQNVCGKTQQNVLLRALQCFTNKHFKDLTKVMEREDLINVFQNPDSYKNSPLHYTLSRPCNPKILKKILSQFSSFVNLENEYGWTPLHFVCRYENCEQHAIKNITILLEEGANINIGTVCTPYEVALQNTKLTSETFDLLYPREDLITKDEEDFSSRKWFLEDSKEKEVSIEVIWTVGTVPIVPTLNDKVLQVQLIPGGDWFEKFKHYINPVLTLWSDVNVSRISVSKDCSEYCQLKNGQTVITPERYTISSEESELLGWLKAKGFVGGDVGEEERISVLSFADLYNEYKDNVSNVTETSVKSMLEKLISCKILFDKTIQDKRYIINLQEFVKTMHCRYEDVDKWLKEYLGADVWDETGSKTKKGPAAFTLKLGLFLKETVRRATLLYQPMCVASSRILAPKSVYREGDTVELYLRSANLTLELAEYSISITTDTKSFSARMFYVLRLALAETMLSYLNCDYKVKILCNCGKPIGELTLLNEVPENTVAENEPLGTDYKAPLFSECPNNCDVIQVPKEDVSKCSVLTKLSDITLEHQVGLDLTESYFNILNDFKLTKPYLKTNTNEGNGICQQTALFYMIIKLHGHGTLRDFYRASKEDPSKKQFALDLLKVHNLDEDDTKLCYEKFANQWMGVTALMAVLVTALVIGLSAGIGFDLGYTGLTAIPAVFAFSTLVYKLRVQLEKSKGPEYSKVDVAREKGEDIEMKGKKVEKLGEIVEGFNELV